MVLDPDETRDLLDRLFELRAACEDVAIAVGEGAPTAELAPLTEHLLEAARRAERLR